MKAKRAYAELLPLVKDLPKVVQRSFYGSSVFKWALVSLLITLTISPLLYFQAHIPVEQTVSYLWNEEELQIGRALWVRDDDLNLRLGCDPAKCHCIYVEEVSAPRVLSYFQQDKPLCIQQRPYRQLLKLGGVAESSVTQVGGEGPTLWYTSDVKNIYHITHFRLLPIFSFMLRHGMEAGSLSFIDPKPKSKVPGDYGLYLLSLLGKQHWAEDFGSPCYVRFESLWVRLRGKWLYPVHSFLPDTPPPLAPAYGKHLDVRWGQLSAFVRRRVAATKPEPLGEDAVVLVQRRDSRLLHDSEHRSYDRLLHVLGEGGINLKPVSLEELSVEEQLGVVTQAKVLVGVHGAALTNMMWQPPVTSTVIEIVFEPRLPDYHNMAMAVGRSYKAFWAESTENKIDPHPAAYERVYVNSSQLLEVIKEALAEGHQRDSFLY